MRPPPLKIEDGTKSSKAASRSASKPPLAADAGARRGPVIIHTYSPKVIQTSTQDFMELVQRLTGSSDTRLRFKKKTKTKKLPPSSSSSKLLVKSKLASTISTAANSDDDSSSFYKPSVVQEFETPQDDDTRQEQDLELFSFKSPLATGSGTKNSDSTDDHPASNLMLGVNAATPSTGALGSSGWLSPIPTPNLLLHHDLFKDLPLLSPIFSPAWHHQLGR